MATIRKPHIILLDEHTAALDPKTAKTVLELTNKIVAENQLTTLMVTHNMRDALKSGNRIMMMHEGNIILDVKGEEKQNLTVPDLLKMFERASGEEMTSDRMLLT
jgi:putative ABC transport system ATP-binding protein